MDITTTKGAPLQYLASITDSYTDNAKPFIDYMKDKPFNEASVTCYIESLSDLNSAATRNIRVYAVKNRLRAAMDYGQTPPEERYKVELFMGKFPKWKIQREIDPDRLLSADQLRSFIEECTDRKLTPIVEFMATQGCRISEALTIKLSNMTRRKGYFEVRVEGKGKKQRTLKVDADLIKRIKSIYHGSTYLFEHSHRCYNRSSIYRRFRYQCQVIFGEHHKPHDLRHSFADRMRGKWTDDMLYRYLGHSSSRILNEWYGSKVASFENVLEARI